MKFARNLRPRTWQGAAEVVFQLAWTALAIDAAVRSELWARVVGTLLLFAATWRWFSILHSSTHQAVVAGRRGNDLVGLLASAFALLPYFPWKEAHLAHHRWTGWQGRDPSLDFPRVESAPRSLKRTMDVCWRFHVPFFSLYFILGKLWTVSNAAPAAGTTTKLRPLQIVVSYVVLVGVHAGLTALLGARYLAAFAPAVLAYLVTSDMVLLNQHSEFAQRVATDVSRPLHPVDHLVHTRSVLLPEWLSRHVLLRFDWHALHHLYPGVPHYRLAPLRAHVGLLPNEISLMRWLWRAQRTPGHRLALSHTETSAG